MDEKYFRHNHRALERSRKIRDFFCQDDKCTFICSLTQKNACLEYYWMLAEGDKPLEEILK